jgi:hypothetical protein
VHSKVRITTGLIGKQNLFGVTFSDILSKSDFIEKQEKDNTMIPC